MFLRRLWNLFFNHQPSASIEKQSTITTFQDQCKEIRTFDIEKLDKQISSFDISKLYFEILKFDDDSEDVPVSFAKRIYKIIVLHSYKVHYYKPQDQEFFISVIKTFSAQLWLGICASRTYWRLFQRKPDILTTIQSRDYLLHILCLIAKLQYSSLKVDQHESNYANMMFT